GDQKQVDQWYEHLPVVDVAGNERGYVDQLIYQESFVVPVTRKFGIIRYTACPEAMPPTLTLYVGHPAVDLNRLDLPVTVTVEAATFNRRRNTIAENSVGQAIGEFVSAHEAKRVGA